MKRIFILFIAVCLFVLSHSVSASIFIKGPIWYNDACNPYSYGDIKEISVSDNYVGIATECNCNVNRAEACNGVFIFDINPTDTENVPGPFVYSTNGWIESVHVDKNQAAAGSSDNNIYYFEVNEYGFWQKKWDKNLEGTVLSVRVSGNSVAAASGNYVHFFDTAGNEKWKYNANSKINKVTIIDNKVVAGTKDGYVHILDVSGNIIKKTETGGAIDTIYAADGVIAVGSDQIYVFDSNGNEKWKSGTTGIIKSVHFADGTLVAGSLSNRVHIFDMDGKSKAEYLASSGVWSVHVFGNHIAVGSADGTIYLIDTKGELRWQYKVGISPTIRSSAVSSVYNTKNYVYVGGWGKTLYLFNSGIAIAEDEITKADRVIMYVKGEMDTSEAEAILKEAKIESELNNYENAVELSKSVEPTIVDYIEIKIKEMEDSLNKLNETIDTEKYTGVSTELQKQYINLENARELLSKNRYVESLRILKAPMGLIKKEIEKIINSYDDTVKKAAYWDEAKVQSLLAQESEYTAMSKEETEAEISLAGEPRADFSESENKIDLAKKALKEEDYEAAIKLSEEAIELVEIKINEIIDDAEKDVKEIEETPLVFKVKTATAEKDISTARMRLEHKKCGAKYETDCPDYSAAIFWAGHAIGIANQDKTIGIVKNAVIGIVVLFAIFVAFRLTRSKKKEEIEEAAEEEGEEKEGA